MFYINFFTFLKYKIESVKISNRITDSPCCLVSSDFGWTANMERIMKAQALGQDNQLQYMMAKKILEINPEHGIIKKLKEKHESDENSIKDITWLLFESSIIPAESESSS